ncbi:Mor transcription activator family protein [Paralysiella testudinis]|uniref:Mor transcription activator domain-containing protein n=1 Tax=Paralysiella testudinis TaxID=2809020 RepID=A0A892ZH66_9NEIS|nr:Mor transcription activator family protein [Paralysiella testudinis]QRQ81086.1 hypothetical protein JQU52_10150 [Paralysiella testudinis]
MAAYTVKDFVAVLTDAVLRQLLSQGMPRSKAEAAADEVVDLVIDELGGWNFYVPKDISTRARARNRKIYEEWSGNNHDDLALKYGLTRTRIYTIIKEVRAQIFAEKQSDLFDEPENAR